jgi:protein involved in polysaccharide export with SLBB domain
MLILSLVMSMITINYTVAGAVCKKTVWSERTLILINDKWYTLESEDDALSVNSGDNVTIDVIERPTLEGTYRGIKAISYVERAPIRCDTCKCNCSASGV